MITMMAFSIVLCCSACYFFISFILKKQARNYVKLLLSISGFLLSYYGFILCTHQSIFYFQAPYEDRFSTIVSLSAFVPNILALIILPFIYWNYLVMKSKSWTFITRNLFLVNNVIYVFLICLFLYWRLFWFWQFPFLFVPQILVKIRQFSVRFILQNEWTFVQQ